MKAVLSSHYMHAVLVVILILVALSAYQRYSIAVEVEGRRVVAEQEGAALQARQAELQADVQYLRDDRGIEAELRRQFDVAKEGERVVVIVEPEAEPEVEPLPTSTPKRSWYEFWR